MAETDALSNFKFGGKFIKLSQEDSPRILRVVTLDPVVSIDKFGSTRFAFTAWDHTYERAGILNAAPGLTKQLQAIQQNEDYEGLRNTDVKIVTTGSGLDTRHVITPRPKSEVLTAKMVEELKAIDLDGTIENGQRMSFYNKDKFESDSKDVDNLKEAGLVEDEVITDIGDEPINLDNIPF
jgi:hypothetical protein